MATEKAPAVEPPLPTEEAPAVEESAEPELSDEERAEAAKAAAAKVFEEPEIEWDAPSAATGQELI